MKILYITYGEKVDYLSDCVFHGLYALYGDQVVDCDRIWYMWEKDPEVRRQLYGRGFTVTGLLEKDTTDRDDIETKIKTRYFDWIFYGSVHRSREHVELVLDHYPRNRIVAFDGEDHCRIASIGTPVPYFKRELYDEDPDIFPISFAIPECKVRPSIPTEKSQLYATAVPDDRSTYIFYSEEAYYADYAASYFGRTQKKGGWDCLRHYEILGNGCIPYFPDLSDCPPRIMANFPKVQVIEAGRLADTETLELGAYQEHLNALFAYTRANLTTKALAGYVLSQLRALL